MHKICTSCTSCTHCTKHHVNISAVTLSVSLPLSVTCDPGLKQPVVTLCTVTLRTEPLSAVCHRYRMCAAATRHLFYRLSNVMLWLAFFLIYLTKLLQSIVYLWA
jgi:hypothetical protein